MEAQTKVCQNCKTQFTIEPEDFQFYEKISAQGGSASGGKVPPPTFCVDCRQQRRIAFRNEQSLYKRTCDRCGASIVSRSSPDKPYPLYCQPCWWSDDWDPTSYGRDYDFSKPFFQQFKELFYAVPHISLLSTNTVQSEWVNNETDDKNCYLNVGGHFNENSAYNTYELYGKECFDNYWAEKCELCYECIQCERCYKTRYSQECYDCRDAVLSYDCRNCLNIIGCAGLRNKQYCIWNEQHTKESYRQFLDEHPLSSQKLLAELTARAMAVWRAVPHRDRLAIRTVNASGNYIIDAKNAQNCWNAESIENCKNLYLTIKMKDSYDGASVCWSELCYEGGHSGGLYSSKFYAYIFGGTKVDTVNCSFLEYCYTTPTSNNCFGCVNLRKQEYCILNKKYSKEEYEALVPKIRKHMMDMPYTDARGRVYRYGEFFPAEFSPFGYNETVAQDYFPLSRERALAEGYSWCDYKADTHYEFSDYQIPDDIKDVKDDILEKILKCEATGKAYRIIPMELQFYRQIGIPIPRRAPLTRHRDRFAKMLPRKLFPRQCECVGSGAARNDFKNSVSHPHGTVACSNSIETPYAPDRPEIVYCEQCYQAEIA